MMRIGLFVATNLAVLFVLSIVLNLLGLNQPGQGTGGFLIMAAVFGMGGSFISLLMSKTLAARSVGAQVIETPRTGGEQWLMNTVARLAQHAGIGMPDVAVFDSPTPNAFATGANKDAALVAVSTGLLRNMSEDEVEAVLGHEIAHVANGDMVTLALLQGVMNTFVMVFAHLLAAVIDRSDGRENHGMGYYIGYYVSQAVLGFLAAMIVMWFSRYREYRADDGGARLAGRQKMINALERLRRVNEPHALPGGMAAFGIAGGLGELLATHPPLEKRIAALRAAA
ncbi:MAG: protease HtpX [Gammaproteobacteria bacterium]|nr:protease HtpX [Gammaproteobacteria bacterium]